MDLQFELLFSLAVIAALYGSVGHGGASGYLAVLSLSIFASQGAIWLKPHALCLNLVVASIGLYHYSRRGFFSMKLIQPFILMSIPFAFVGAYLPIIDWLFDIILSFTLLWAAWRLVMAVNIDGNIYKPPSHGVSLAVGACLGFVSGLVGIGGGIFLSPLLILKGWASTKATAAVSALFIIVNSIAALAGVFSSGQAQLDSDLIIQFSIAVLIGGFMGTRFGANHASDHMIRRLLAVVLVVAAVRTVLDIVGLWP